MLNLVIKLVIESLVRGGCVVVSLDPSITVLSVNGGPKKKYWGGEDLKLGDKVDDVT